MLSDELKLETKRLILRPVKLNDAKDMFEYASDELTTRYVLFERHETLAQSKEIIKTVFLTRKERGLPVSWALELKASGKMIGTCGFTPARFDNFELGYILNSAYWRQGYMFEAASAILAYAFHTYGVRRLEVRHLAENIASQALINKLDFIYEGRKVAQTTNKQGSFSDILEYRLLKEEYEKRA